MEILIVCFGAIVLLVYMHRHSSTAEIRQRTILANARVKVIEFKSMKDYAKWLAMNENQIKIIDVSTQRRWSLLTGFLGRSQNFTVTYEKVILGGIRRVK